MDTSASGKVSDLGEILCKPSLRILVVEDHPDALTVRGMVLQSLGHLCSLAPDAGVALVKTGEERFDAIFTDVDLLGMDGWELLRRLALLGQLPLLVISMSAGTTLIQTKRSEAAGCRAHLVKPFRLSEVESALY